MDAFISIIRGFSGIVFLLLICYALSAARSRINWRIVGVGLLSQFVLIVAILKVPFVSQTFDIIARFFSSVLRFSEAGALFLFGDIVAKTDTFGYIFAFQVLPTIVFFSALSAVLYYFGILQKIIYVIAYIMTRTMKLSGPESLASAANIFLGQTEAPLVVKPYLENMSKSELLCLMTGGMATIAGGVFAAYIGFLGGSDPVMQVYFAKHLLSASIISAPAAIIASKMLYPETETKDLKAQLQMSSDVGSNLLDAISRGTTDGLKLAVNVGAMLLVFTALIYMANQLLMNSIGEWTGINQWIIKSTSNRFEGLTFTYLLGLIFSPIAWIIGTPKEDVLLIGQLLGQKTVINEFVAYAELNKLRASGIEISEKAIIIATYALCGFSNFASIGIQIGGISALAPGQRKALTQFGIKALIGGTVACFMTACLAGMFF
jgi:CNT family concentrative nucleoside transporter